MVGLRERWENNQNEHGVRAAGEVFATVKVSIDSVGFVAQSEDIYPVSERSLVRIPAGPLVTFPFGNILRFSFFQNHFQFS